MVATRMLVSGLRPDVSVETSMPVMVIMRIIMMIIGIGLRVETSMLVSGLRPTCWSQG